MLREERGRRSQSQGQKAVWDYVRESKYLSHDTYSSRSSGLRESRTNLSEDMEAWADSIVEAAEGKGTRGEIMAKISRKNDAW